MAGTPVCWSYLKHHTQAFLPLLPHLQHTGLFWLTVSEASVYGQLAARQGYHSRRMWQRKAAQPTAVRKQQQRGGTRDKIHFSRSYPQWTTSKRPHLSTAQSATEIINQRMIPLTNLASLWFNHLQAWDFWDILDINHNKHVLKCVCYGMINLRQLSYVLWFLVVKALKIYSFSNFQEYTNCY